MWKSAIARAGSGSTVTSQGPIQSSAAKASATPASRLTRLPPGSRRPAPSSLAAPSSTRLTAAPRFAPSTRANAACGGTTPLAARVMISRMMATLECAAQVSKAASNTAMTGSVATLPSSIHRLGTSSYGVNRSSS